MKKWLILLLALTLVLLCASCGKPQEEEVAEEEEPVEEPSIFAVGTEEDNTELDKQIEDLDLSVRSYNCLKRAGIHSVRQLVEFSENDLLNIRNFGVKSIEEVKDKLESMGRSLKA